jgi:hypothetical protein
MGVDVSMVRPSLAVFHAENFPPWYSVECATARKAAFMPGASPPKVSTPIVFDDMGLLS